MTKKWGLTKKKGQEVAKQKRPSATRLLLTDRSLRDLSAIEAYSIEQWGKRAATKYLSQIEDALSRIQENPDLLMNATELHPSLHFYTVNKHVLVFDVRAEAMVLLTAFHGSMDIPARLADLEPTLATEIEILHRKLGQSR